MAVAPPSPSPPPLKTIIQEVVRPFCGALRGNLGAAVVLQGRNNQIIVQMFPLLNKYNRALVEHSDSDAYFAARKVDALELQLTQNLKQIQSALASYAAASPAPFASPDPDNRLTSLRQNLTQVYKQQLVAQETLDQFVGEALYSAAPEGRQVMAAVKQDNTLAGAAAALSGGDDSATLKYLASHTAPVAMVSMPQLPEILNQRLQNIDVSEKALRPVVQQGVDECFKQ